jgi:hypothetical protein
MKLARIVTAAVDLQAPVSGLSRGGMLGRLRQMAREKANADANVIAQRFRREDRPAIRRFVATSFGHADVAEQFALLAFMIATKQVPTEQRIAAEDAIAAGAPLQKVARLAGIPMWARAIPPASCIDPSGPLPQSADFACRISDVLRRRVDEECDLRGMLRTVAQMHASAGEELALWLACRYPEGGLGEQLPEPLRILALWYLLSKAGPCLGRELIYTHWRRDLSLETAIRSAKNFARRIDLELLVGPDGLEDPWFSSAHLMGLDFVPLLTSTEIREEGLRNHNCLDWYAQRLASNEVRLFSVRNAQGVCVANVEVSGSESFPNIARIAQIKAPKNDPADPTVSSIAEIWLRRQIRSHGMPDMRRRKPPVPSADRWREIVAPMRAAGTLPVWAEACPTNSDLARTELEFSVLGYRLHARGWRFA